MPTFGVPRSEREPTVWECASRGAKHASCSKSAVGSSIIDVDVLSAPSIANWWWWWWWWWMTPRTRRRERGWCVPCRNWGTSLRSSNACWRCITPPTWKSSAAAATLPMGNHPRSDVIARRVGGRGGGTWATVHLVPKTKGSFAALVWKSEECFASSQLTASTGLSPFL